MEPKKRRALIRALRRNVTPDPPLPPPLPREPPGMVTWMALRHGVLTAAAGHSISVDAYHARRRADRLQRALDKHEAEHRPRASTQHNALLAPVGLLGMALSPPLTLTPEQELARAKLERVHKHARRLDAIARSLEAQLFAVWNQAGEFLRTLGVQDALVGETIDAAGRRRRLHARAWGHQENWERLKRERMFEAGDEPLSSPGVPFFPQSMVDTLTAFVSENGEAALHDVDGARRALGAGAPKDPHANKTAKPNPLHQRIRQIADALNPGEGPPAMKAKVFFDLIRKKIKPERAENTLSDSTIKEALKGTKHLRAPKR